MNDPYQEYHDLLDALALLNGARSTVAAAEGSSFNPSGAFLRSVRHHLERRLNDAFNDIVGRQSLGG